MHEPDIVLGFDFGLKRIGCAVGNDLTASARPCGIIRGVTNDEKFRQISEIIDQWKPARLVVGLPMYPDGTEHEMTKRCRRFANQLNGRFSLETILVDERYTSSMFHFKRGQADDAHAAALILQQYFDETIS